MARWNVKRIAFLSVAAGCVIVLILAMAGVFRRAPAPVEPKDSIKSANPGEIVIDKPFSRGEDWQMTAARAFILPDNRLHFIEPVIRYKQKPANGAGPDRNIRVTADEGFSESQDASEVHLKNHVVAKMEREASKETAKESGVLRTDDLVWNKKTGVGQTASSVRGEYVVGEKTYTVGGDGFTMDGHRHTAKFDRNVRLVLSGETGFMSTPTPVSSAPQPNPPSQPQQPPPATDEKTIVECEGTFFAEEATNSATLEKNVTVTRGDQVIKTDRLIAHLVKSAQGETVVDQWQALGHVRVTMAKTELEGAKLLRGADGYMTLIGNSPCSVKLEGMLIEGESISMNMESGEVTVPGAGKLVMQQKPAAPPSTGETPANPPKEGEPRPVGTETPVSPPKEGQPKPPEAPPKPTTATWDGGMTFDRKEGKATFTKNVHVVGSDMDITCRFMTLWMSADRTEAEKLLAEGDVHMITSQATATGNSILYLLKEQRLELKGEPVATIEEKDHTVTSSNIQLDQATGKVSTNTPGTLTAVLAPEKGSQEPRQAKVTWAKSMSYNEKAGEGHFEGNVTMNSVTREIIGDSMLMKLTAPPQRDMQSIDAVGQVAINWEGRRGFCHEFTWEADGGKGHLLGKPAVPDQPGRPGAPRERARVAFEQGWLRGEVIQYSENFDHIAVTGEQPVEASVTTKGSHSAESLLPK